MRHFQQQFHERQAQSQTYKKANKHITCIQNRTVHIIRAQTTSEYNKYNKRRDDRAKMSDERKKKAHDATK